MDRSMSDDSESQTPTATSRIWSMSYAIARRTAVALIGSTLLVIGAIFLLTPGPGLLVLSAGLGVLALEFAWARRWLRRVKASASRLAHAATIESSPPPSRD
jgi:tellurite resistance protein TerC